MAERNLIPAHAVQIGMRAYLEPQRPGLPRGFKSSESLHTGWQVINAWTFGLINRGQALAFTDAPTETGTVSEKPTEKRGGK